MAKHERGFVMLSTPRSSSLGSQHHRFVAIVNMSRKYSFTLRFPYFPTSKCKATCDNQYYGIVANTNCSTCDRDAGETSTNIPAVLGTDATHAISAETADPFAVEHSGILYAIHLYLCNGRMTLTSIASSIAMLEVAKFAVASTRVSPGFEAEEGEAVPKKFSAGELCYELQG